MKRPFVVIIFVGLIITAIYLSQQDRPTTSSKPEPTAKPTVAVAATATPAATKAPATLESDIVQALGPSNRNVKRLVDFRIDTHIIFVTFAINDNLSENLIKRSAKMDTVDILECVAKHDPAYKEAQLVGTFPLVDEFGNSAEADVVWLTYSRGTIGKINFDGFLSDNAYTVADQVVVHPAFTD